MGGVILVAVTGCTSGTGPSEPVSPTGSATDAAAATTGTVAGTGLMLPDTDAAEGAPRADSSSPGTAPLGPPAAATLPWLDGQDSADGIVLGEVGGQRWFGRHAGETATLGDGWYRYFGADGSLVGCTSAGRCIGIGRDNTVAVVAEPGAPRDVYQADGTYRGRYSAEGELIGGGAVNAASFTEAIAATGVDVAGLVDAAMRLPPFAGAATGDPHFITAGGQRYTTQATGQFVARTGDSAHEIQLQFVAMPHRADVSIVSAVAIGSGSDVVVADMAGTVTINGQQTPRVAEFTQSRLAGGATVGTWPVGNDGFGTVVVAWPDGSAVTVMSNRALGMTVIAHLPQIGDGSSPAAPNSQAGSSDDPSGDAASRGAAGLFGAELAASGSDLLTRGGASAGDAGGTTIAVASWRVPPTARLFPSAGDPVGGLMSEPIVVDPGAHRTARALCADRGLQRGDDVAACAFDVALTGDTAFIPGHLAASTAATALAVPPGFAARWPALQIPPTASMQDLPSDGQLQVTIAAGDVRVYRATVATGGSVSLVTADEAAGPHCAAGSASPAMDEPAWRLFDASGRPASSRLPLCGLTQTGSVTPGEYLLLIGNAVDNASLDASLDVDVDVRIP